MPRGAKAELFDNTGVGIIIQGWVKPKKITEVFVVSINEKKLPPRDGGGSEGQKIVLRAPGDCPGEPTGLRRGVSK